jgi:hypothetical protein
MQNATQPHQEFENCLLQRIANSDRYKMYQEAFRTATGLPLRIVSSDPDGWCLDEQKINRSAKRLKLQNCAALVQKHLIERTSLKMRLNR